MSDATPHLLLPPPMVVAFTDTMAETAHELADSRQSRAKADAANADALAENAAVIAQATPYLRRLVAIEEARDKKEQERREARGAVEVYLTSKPMIGVYTSVATAVVLYLLTTAGIMPAAFVPALPPPAAQDAPEVPHALPPHASADAPTEPAPRPTPDPNAE